MISPPAPQVLAADALAEQVLRPHAEWVDQHLVPRTHLDALSQAGLLGVTAPAELGGGGAPAAVGRAVAETLAGACGATWFVWTQLALPLSTMVRAQHPRAGELASGTLLSGVAVAHLRRPGPPAVTATPVASGWRLDGHVGWMTGWGLCQVFVLFALTAAGQVVSVLVEAKDQPGLTSSAPMRLAAMAATSTVVLDLDGLLVGPEAVVEVVDAAVWQAADSVKTVNASPHNFGLQRETTRLLALAAESHEDPTAARLATRLAEQGEQLRDTAYALIDEVPAGEQLDVRLAVRAQTLDLVMRSATALVAATGGSAMALDAAPQRLAREAMFQVVQAQTAPVREASLSLMLAQGTARR